MAVLTRATPPAQNGDSVSASGGHEGWTQTMRRDTWTSRGKAPPDRPALKPYRGKPAVRNFRGDDGDVGIIRSPVRAIALPDRGYFTGETDAAFGDSVFEAALAKAKGFKSRDAGTGNYSHFWLVERDFDNRTSLIVDPPDGRIPP